MKLMPMAVLLIIISACSQANGDGVSFQEQVNEEFDAAVYIPQIDEYPIRSAEIQHIPVADNKDLIVQYSKEKGELKEDAYIKKYEKNRNADVLHGIYDGEPLIVGMTYNNGKGSINDSKTKTMNGIEVEYHEIKNNNAEMLAVSFDVTEGSYLMEFNLNGELTKEKAFGIVEEITKEVNE